MDNKKYSDIIYQEIFLVMYTIIYIVLLGFSDLVDSMLQFWQLDLS